MLTKAQKKALEHIKQSAQADKEKNLTRIRAVLADENLNVEPDGLIEAIRRTAALTVNFHPDRLIANGISVIAALYEDGIYRSQFETKISNGGLTAHSGGDRDNWEARMFGGAYQAEGVTDAERPKYGGLNIMNYIDGACPRFGSCHLLLKQNLMQDATFTFGDSATEPTDIGVLNAFEPVLAGMLENLSKNGEVLGKKNVSVSDFVIALLVGDQDFFKPIQGRALDDYIEAQIHHEINLANDVQAIIADPSFQGTATGIILEATAKKFDVSLDWHHGFELAPSEMPDHFRGTEIPALAKQILERHSAHCLYVDAAIIGMAAESVVTNSELWSDWGASKEVLQHIKYIWHTLVVFGNPKNER